MLVHTRFLSLSDVRLYLRNSIIVRYFEPH